MQIWKLFEHCKMIPKRSNSIGAERYWEVKFAHVSTIDIIHLSSFIIIYHHLSSIYHPFIIIYHPFIIHLSSIYHPFIIHLSSIYHHLSSIYHPFIIHLSSIYHGLNTCSSTVVDVATTPVVDGPSRLGPAQGHGDDEIGRIAETAMRLISGLWTTHEGIRAWDVPSSKKWGWLSIISRSYNYL